jgi:hypothetical protein
MRLTYAQQFPEQASYREAVENPDWSVGFPMKDVRFFRAVCTENFVPFDLVTESPNVGGDDRAVILSLGPVCLDLQAQEPTRSGECCPQAPGDGTAAQGARSGPVHQQ